MVEQFFTFVSYNANVRGQHFQSNLTELDSLPAEEKENLEQLNRCLLENPDFEPPSNYKIVSEKEYSFNFTYSDAVVSQLGKAFTTSHEVINQILLECFKYFNIHWFNY